MRIQQISENECRAILARAPMGRLGCALDNQPYVIPVYFAYEESYIYVFATLGRKIEWMRANPKVCFQVDEVKSALDWISVIANGQFEELPVPQYSAEVAHARGLLEKRHGWWMNAMAERRMDVSDELIAPLFFRIRMDSVSGLAGIGEGEESS